MKKIAVSFLMLIILMNSFPLYVKAKTVGDLKNELNAKIKEYEENKDKIKLTEEEIKKIHAQIDSINNEITSITDEMLELTNEIEKLEQDIIEKEKELKQILNFLQISTSESIYMEYVFGAKDFTDFIYRAAIAEQLSNYTDTTIKEYNNMVKINNDKKKQLGDKKIALNATQKNLEKELKKLGNQLSTYDKNTISIDSEIEALKESIDMYVNRYSCSDEDDIDVCTREQLPPDTSFYRPLEVGYVTSEYGWYSPFGYLQFHYGMDFSTYDNGRVPVYSMASGVVVAKYHQTCGNNIVVIAHNVKGESYTTMYWHMRKTYVEIGDKVTKDTQVGIMGGAASDHDSCSTGAHVHVTISTGLFMTDYTQFSTLNAHRFNPRLVLNAPSLYVSFYDRTTKY